MDLPMQMRRSLLSLALLALVGTAAVAQASDETLIAVKTRAGTIERVDAGDVGTLQPGETRALGTRAGSAATITRTDNGLLLAIAGDQYPIEMPGGLDGDVVTGEDIVFRRHDGHQSTQADGQEVHRIVVLKHKGADTEVREGADALAGLGIPDFEDDEALLAAGDGPKVFVQRRKVIENGAAQ